MARTPRPTSSLKHHEETKLPIAPDENDPVHRRELAMSKLSPGLKALINAPFSRPDPAAAPSGMREVYAAIAREASRNKVGLRPWVAISSAATFTLNSPESLSILHKVACSHSSSSSSNTPSRPSPVETAELIREVGLKCISFNGIPRTINCLNAFHASLPSEITSQLETEPSRKPTADILPAMEERGRALWNSVYAPFEDKLLAKLGVSHPDLPVHILNSHYATLLSDPPAEGRGGLAPTGRVLTSLIAIACLRAQTGVGPQVLSHVFGLRKALEDPAVVRGAEAEEGAAWLAGDEGSEWILRSVDSISQALGGGNFARGAKL